MPLFRRVSLLAPLLFRCSEANCHLSSKSGRCTGASTRSFVSSNMSYETRLESKDDAVLFRGPLLVGRGRQQLSSGELIVRST